MHTLILIISLSLASTAWAQSFPTGFIGHWEGQLQWSQPGKPDPQKIKMQLIIRAVDSGLYTWQLIYGEQGTDNRPYILKPVDSTRGHWVVDEGNGILLDQYWIGNRLMNSFTLQTTTIFNSYWLEGDHLLAEFSSFSTKPVTISGKGTEDVPEVKSFGVKAYQKAILQRRN